VAYSRGVLLASRSLFSLLLSFFTRTAVSCLSPVCHLSVSIRSHSLRLHTPVTCRCLSHGLRRLVLFPSLQGDDFSYTLTPHRGDFTEKAVA
jgi:hypothetical protein